MLGIEARCSIFMAKVRRAISGWVPLVNKLCRTPETDRVCWRPRWPRALKQILQIVIAVAVQSTNGDLFLRSFELPVDLTVIGAAMRLGAKSAVRPELPLAAETVRVCRMPGSTADRIGSIEGIWRSLVQTWCFLLSASSLLAATRNDPASRYRTVAASKYPINALIASQPSEGRDIAGARSLGKFVVSRRGEAYDAHEQEVLIGNPGLGPCTWNGP
jgi:hypothetical protein